MAKPLSEQLADLSVHAKRAEDTLAAAQKETHEKIMSRWEQARADATAATEMVNRQIQSVGDSVAKDWNARKAKIAADMDALKAKVVRKRRELGDRLCHRCGRPSKVGRSRCRRWPHPRRRSSPGSMKRSQFDECRKTE